MSSLNGKALDFGEHAKHAVHLHAHVTRDRDAPVFCSRRWLCASCADKEARPRGLWFDGPLCPGTVGKDGKR